MILENWSGRRDSNPRPQPWQGCALPLSYARSGVRRGCTPPVEGATSIGLAGGQPDSDKFFTGRPRDSCRGLAVGGLRPHKAQGSRGVHSVATLGMSAADREAVEVFRRDVVEPSMTQLVIVDFWAEWCGPCKQLGPVIEKVAKDYAARGVKLVKIDVDKDKFIAAQFRIQSIPTVYALFQGQPVADLTNARTESQLSRMLDQLLAQLPVQAGDADPATADVEQFVAMAQAVLAEGDAERALSIFEQVAEMAPDNLTVIAGRAQALLQLGRVGEAEDAIAAVPADKAKDAAFTQVRAAIALAKDASPVADLAALARQVETTPDDLDKRYELAGGLMAIGDRDGAADQLLASIAQDRTWNDGAARDRLLKLFAAVGLEDPWVSAQRRRLSSILFT